MEAILHHPFISSTDDINRDTGPPHFTQILTVARQLIRALHYLELNNIVHKNITRDSVSNGNLTNFSQAEFIYGNFIDVDDVLAGGSFPIDAGDAFVPVSIEQIIEAVNNEKPTIPAPTPFNDMWNLGCLIYEWCTGKVLFSVQPSSPSTVPDFEMAMYQSYLEDARYPPGVKPLVLDLLKVNNRVLASDLVGAFSNGVLISPPPTPHYPFPMVQDQTAAQREEMCRSFGLIIPDVFLLPAFQQINILRQIENADLARWAKNPNYTAPTLLFYNKNLVNLLRAYLILVKETTWVALSAGQQIQAIIEFSENLTLAANPLSI